MSKRARVAAVAVCVIAFFIGIFADNLGLVGWWAK